MSSTYYRIGSAIGGGGGGGGGGGSVNSVTASSPVLSSGGTNPNISILQASAFQAGALSAADWTTFNSKQDPISLGTGNGLTFVSNVLSLGLSSTSTTGALSSTDWNTFNSKQSALTLGNITDIGTDGITITGGTGAVIGSGVTLSQAKASASQNGYLASTDWSTFNSKANEVIPTTNQMVFVNYLVGNDSTGTGAYDAPFQTVAHAMTTITDSSQSKPYVIALQADRQVETTDVLMKPFTFIVGQMQRATYMRINGGGALKPDPSQSTLSSWNGLSNVYWGGASPINWDLQAVGGSGPGCVFVIQNCTINGAFTYKGRASGAGDFLEVYTGLFFQAVAIDSVNAQIQSMEFFNTVAITDTQSVSPGATFNNCVFDAAVSFTNAGTYNMRNCAYASGVTLTTSGTLTIDSFRGLPTTANRSLSGGTTIVNLDDATIVPYTPTTPGNWSVVPTNAQQGLDYLAARTVPTNNVEYHTVTSGEATAKQFTLTSTPAAASSVVADVITGGPQEFSVDYTVSGNVFNWNGLGLDGILSTGDVVRLIYNS